MVSLPLLGIWLAQRILSLEAQRHPLSHHFPLTHTLHSRSHVYTHPGTYSHNVPRRLKEGENSASTLHRTKIKNNFTLKLTEKKFQNHMHRLRKKNRRAQQIFGTQCSYFVYLLSLARVITFAKTEMFHFCPHIISRLT